MHTFKIHAARLFTIAALVLLSSVLPMAHAADAAPVGTGYLVVTPDRGFLGNDEIRDAFAAFAGRHNAELLFVTDARSKDVLNQALSDLRQRGADRIAVLPLVLSEADTRWKLARSWFDQARKDGARLAFAPLYGASYLAVEDLSARLRSLHTDKRKLLLLGYGAASPADATRMAEGLKRMAGFASDLPADAIHAVVYPGRKAAEEKAMRKAVSDAIKSARDSVVVPVALAPRADSMMSFSGWFGRDLPKDAELVTSQIATADALTQWMQRAATEAGMQFAPLLSDQIGIVALVHGADWFWNRDIRQALAPLARKHKLAYAFSMADPPVVERAVRKLEGEGVRAIVVVRAFGMAASFLPTVRHMLGADVESGAAPHAGHGMAMMMHHGHGGSAHASLAAAPRIRSALPMVTVGGVEDDPFFAKALLQNARGVSSGNPARETVILVAHGQGDDKANRKWLDLLSSLAKQMRAVGGGQFAAIETATWREDWPDKNKVEVKRVRGMVEQASRHGGRVLIVPARINGRGAADRYLEGLDYGWSEGFAQTPYFAQWFEQEIGRGVDRLNTTYGTDSPVRASHGHRH